MSRPQQPELARSAKTDLDPDHVETGLQGQRKPKADGPTGPVPPDNQPGHHPPKEQDKPDLDAFAAKLGTDPKAPSATSARKPSRPKVSSPKSAPGKTTESKQAPAKSTPAKSPPNRAAPAKSSSRPAAAGSQSPAASAKIETTPAKRPAAAPGWPESAPAADDLGPLDEQPRTQEPLMVSWAMLPLRET